MNSTTSDAGRPPDSRAKAVLFCFDCGHESSVDGDWELEPRESGEEYQCPECGTTITVRPEAESESSALLADGSGCGNARYGVGD